MLPCSVPLLFFGVFETVRPFQFRCYTLGKPAVRTGRLRLISLLDWFVTEVQSE